MIYLKTENYKRILILEPANLDHLKTGEVLVGPDKSVMIMYTPDIVWLADKLMENAEQLTPNLIDSLHRESMGREPVYSHPKHPVLQMIDNGKLVGGGTDN